MTRNHPKAPSPRCSSAKSTAPILRPELGEAPSSKSSTTPAAPSPTRTRPDRAGRSKRAISAIPPMPRSTTCRRAPRSSPSLKKTLDAQVAAFRRGIGIRSARPQAEARQPVDQRARTPGHAFRPYPSPQHHFRHLLRCHSRRRLGPALRGSAAHYADDEPPRRASPARARTTKPSCRYRRRRARSCCGKASCAMKFQSTWAKMSASR